LKGCIKPVNQAPIEQRKKAFKENQKNNQGNQGGNKNNTLLKPMETEKGR
jgi:hypothetical protein